jgi:hypothetical protein
MPWAVFELTIPATNRQRPTHGHCDRRLSSFNFGKYRNPTNPTDCCCHLHDCGLQMEETASAYEELLRICWISNRGSSEGVSTAACRCEGSNKSLAMAWDLTDCLAETVHKMFSNGMSEIEENLKGREHCGRPKCRSEDNIKINLSEIGRESLDCIQMTQDRVQSRAVVNIPTVMNLRVP